MCIAKYYHQKTVILSAILIGTTAGLSATKATARPVNYNENKQLEAQPGPPAEAKTGRLLRGPIASDGKILNNNGPYIELGFGKNTAYECKTGHWSGFINIDLLNCAKIL